MAVINIGQGPVGGGGGPTVSNYMYWELVLAANGTGTIIQVDFSFDSLNNGSLDIGTCAISGSTSTMNAYVNINSGSLINQVVTFTSAGADFVAFNVSTGNWIVFFSKDLESTRNASGSLGYHSTTTWVTTPVSVTTYGTLSIETSMIGTTGSSNTFNGIDWGDIATFNGISTADISTINGVTMIGDEVIPDMERDRLGILTLGFISKGRYPKHVQNDFNKGLEKYWTKKTTSYFYTLEAA